MTENKLRNYISKFIFISNGILFLATTIYYLLLGFDGEEFATLLVMLTPINSVYVAAVVKYTVSNKHKLTQEDEKPVNKQYVTLTRLAIPAHFIILFIAISASAFINIPSFEELKIIFGVVETGFGAYVGIIVTSLFYINENKKEIKN